jgi:hypothetical protein
MSPSSGDNDHDHPTGPFDDALRGVLEDLSVQIADRHRDGWGVYDLDLVVGVEKDMAGLDATLVATISGDPVSAMLGRTAAAETEGVLLAYADAAVCAVTRSGIEHCHGAVPELLPAVLRRHLGLTSRAAHRPSSEVARRYVVGVALSFVETGRRLGDEALAAGFVAKFIDEIDSTDAWHRQLCAGLAGDSWAVGAVEDGLRDWVDDDLALALLDARGADPFEALDTIAKLASPEVATRLAHRLSGS